jgi:hypothetical protein
MAPPNDVPPDEPPIELVGAEPFSGAGGQEMSLPMSAPTVEHSAGYLRVLLWLLLAATFFEGYDGAILALVLPSIRDTFNVPESALGISRALIELEDRVLETAMAGEEKRISAAELHRRYDIPREVTSRLAELDVLTPNSRGYSSSDVKIVEAICRFRAGGYDERIGFTVYDTLRYKRALEALVEEEVQVLMERLGDMDTDRAVALIEDGSEPLRDLIAALHQKLLVAEMRRQRVDRAGAR